MDENQQPGLPGVHQPTYSLETVPYVNQEPSKYGCTCKPCEVISDIIFMSTKWIVRTDIYFSSVAHKPFFLQFCLDIWSKIYSRPLKIYVCVFRFVGTFSFLCDFSVYSRSTDMRDLNSLSNDQAFQCALPVRGCKVLWFQRSWQQRSRPSVISCSTRQTYGNNYFSYAEVTTDMTAVILDKLSWYLLISDQNM